MPKATPTASQPRVRAARQRTCNQPQPTRASVQEEGENFSLDISDGDGDSDGDDDGDYDDGDNDNGDDKVNHQPPHRSHARPTVTPAPQKVNNPDTATVSTSKNSAFDIEYFFHKTETARVCRECQ